MDVLYDLYPTIIFFLFFLGWIVSIFGYGSFIHAKILKGINIPKYISWHYAIFGLIVINFLVVLLNIVVPITIEVTILILLIGVILAFFRFKTSIFNWKILFLFLICAGIIFIEITSNWFQYYDTGLYHIPSIKWIIENTIPFGLANLHPRFGFNCTWFPLSSVIEQLVFIFNRPVFLLNGILLFFYSSIIIDTIFSKFNFNLFSFTGHIYNEIRSTIDSLKIYEIFFLLSVFPVFFGSLFFLSSPSPDYPVFIITIVTFGFLIKNIEDNEPLSNFYPWIPIILAFFATAIKLSSIVMVPMTLIALIFHMLKRKSEIKLNINTLYHASTKIISTVPRFCLFLIILIIAPFFIRGIIISGNPFFPISIKNSFFPWSISIAKTQAEANSVTAWARSPGPHYLDSLNSLSWIHDWIIRFWNNQSLFIILTLISIISFFLIYFFTGARNNDEFKKLDYFIYLYPFLFIIVGLVFWFISAPEPRFGLGYLYSLPILLFVYPFLLIKRPHPQWLQNWKVILVIGFLISASFFVFTNYNHKNFIYERGKLPLMPEIELVQKITNNGEIVYTPSKGDQVWNSPLPNTPYFDPNLTIIRYNNNGRYHMFLPAK